MGQHDGHAPRRGRHRFHHVLHPGVVTLFGREAFRQNCGRKGSLAPTSSPHFSSEKKRINDYAVKGSEIIAQEEGRLPQRVTADGGTMQKEVHAGAVSLPVVFPQAFKSLNIDQSRFDSVNC